MIQQPTLFMRIHKTAGEALAKQVADRLPAAQICPHAFEWQVRALPAAEAQRFGFFQGHISASSLAHMFDDLRVFTMLRAPRERLLSCFYYWKQGARHARSDFFDMIGRLTLPQFLRSREPLIRRVTWNVQARLLAGGQFGGTDALRQNVFGRWLGEAELAREAVAALNRFAFVGVTERYRDALGAAFRLLQLGEAPAVERINLNPARPDSYAALLATAEIADALEALTAADQVVYDAALRVLDGASAAA